MYGKTKNAIPMHIDATPLFGWLRSVTIGVMTYNFKIAWTEIQPCFFTYMENGNMTASHYLNLATLATIIRVHKHLYKIIL